MRKLILQCGFSLGDIVMLTAAVRDLHRTYPGRFLTDIRTGFPELWEHNPHITSLSDEDPEAELISCSYPLINRASRTPHHCLQGFSHFLNGRLGLNIEASAFKGDIHLSDREKAWHSQVHEATREDIPFWIVAAGGKYDITIKWWETARYQEVIEHFRGKIQFVQVGQTGDHHPKLEGIIDLRGQTSLRELVRLVYHAQGVLCSVTALMHLAAAVPTKPGTRKARACVVVAGGREPAHWEGYPNHQFIHTNGALPCGGPCGCWKNRVVPLRDGERRDRRENRCVDVVDGLARCMHLIRAAEVIRQIELYFRGGVLRHLSPRQQRAAESGIAKTRRNFYDREPLNLHSAGLALDAAIARLPPYPGGHSGRGIVICGGGVRYFTCAWVCINLLRRWGCSLPIELWHLGRRELSPEMAGLVAPLGVTCRDALQMRRRFPARILRGWPLKPYAILHSRFREVLLMDADNVPVVNPEFLFDTPEFKERGAIFWPDYPSRNQKKARIIWRSCGVRQPAEPEFETGQILVDKERCWPALCLTMWMNENSDFYYQYVHGDKETFHLAFRKLGQLYRLVPTAIHRLKATMCQHDFQGRRLFQHRNLDKWDLFLSNRLLPGFWFEPECRALVLDLQKKWNGGVKPAPARSRGRRRAALSGGSRLWIEAVMISCEERKDVRQRTLENLARTDWDGTPVHLQMDERRGKDPRARQAHCAWQALSAAWERRAEYVLFLEDDLDFNRHLRHNLESWPLIRQRGFTMASLYNPGVRDLECDVKNRARIVAPQFIYGSQAFLISRKVLAHIVRDWDRVPGMQDIKISRLAGRMGNPIYYHAPSLVQHVGVQSLWGGHFHQARDFDPNWKA